MTGFIEKHGLWTAEQRRRGEALAARAEKDGLKLIRLAWPDPHGAARAKALTVPAFLGALRNGHTTSVATTTLDASGARVFASFTPGGGVGLAEMTGSPNLVLVPDPGTFRVLPWEPAVGWVLCDEYFASGKPFPFSPRHLLRRQVARLAERGMGCVVGLEIEWYLRRLDEAIGDAQIGAPGLKGRAPHTLPVEPGYSFHSETNLDRLQPVVNALAEAFAKAGLPVRSFEKEFGPGQMECTFDPTPALEAADDFVFFRTATRQVCRRLGHLATFMCWPRLKGAFPSGWHLHQSLVEPGAGRNLFAPETEAATLSPLGMQYLGGLLYHALGATVFATPTVNGYRRFRRNSLAPDRVCWGSDHRGAMLRVLSAGIGDPAARIENRVGEPWANPYLFMASQIAAGLDGVDRACDPGPPDSDPYATARPMLPTSLDDALRLMEDDPLFTEAFGATFIAYYGRFKRTELGRYESFATDHAVEDGAAAVSEWEHDEYFDFF
jgi:glutamine synthetase